VVLTLHDQAAFTGGCHYSGSCRQYEADCGGCPYLTEEARHVPSLLLARKRRWLISSRLAVVCPSEWMADCARRSTLLQEASVHAIPNSVPVSVYQRTDRAHARARLGLPPDAVVLLTGGHRLDEQRKGHAHTRGALSVLLADSGLRSRFERGDLICAAFGDGDSENGWPIRSLGRLEGDERLALAYRAADLFLLPTLEDNLPNTLLESVAAGTPVVAYTTGGVPDVLKRGRCGIMVPPGDIDALAATVRSLIEEPATLRQLSERCESYAREALDLPVQARAYSRLFESLATRGRCQARGASVASMKTDLEREEAELLRAVTTPAPLAVRLLTDLTAELSANRQLISARGGEIAALRTELDTVLNGWRVSRETLHQAEQNLTALATQRDELSSDISRATAAVASLTTRVARLKAGLAKLQARSSNHMTKVAIWGSGDDARRLWEALMLSGAEVVAFIDHNTGRHGRDFLNAIVQPPSWLASNRFDLLAAFDGDLADSAVRQALGHVNPSLILTVPSASNHDALSRFIAAHIPDSLADARIPDSSGRVLRVGIFGTGSAAMKVWEALADIDLADVVWFADNNPEQQGRTLLWLDTIAPSRIPSRAYDVVVIGSMSRDVIRAQLLELGVPADRILAPDVAAPVDRIRAWLEPVLTAHASEEVAQ
jgi:hypothetical protein